MGNGFSTSDIPDLKGKTFLVTGANKGIGYQTALHLAKHHARVIFACRNGKKANMAMAKIRETLAPYSPQLEFLELDLNSLAQVASAARSFVDKGEQIDVLINNAGIMAVPYRLTQDGIESQFGCNHMGHFVFTTLLLPAIKRGTGRVVVLSSIAHKMTYSFGITDKLEQVYVDPAAPKPAENGGAKHPSEAVYTAANAYGQSKLANLLFAKALAARQPNLHVFAVHPGYVDTDLQRTGIKDAFGGFVATLSAALSTVAAKNPVNGARTTLAAATSPELDNETGLYLVPYGKVATPSTFGTDPDMQKRLWEMSMELVRRILGEQMVAEIERNMARTVE
ncbi:hypothetical protein AMAG_08350 [Allomyces macrogynus ATCC 38327]|uniref:NAD(P)-binding protein n=1 Tax=Allomyces macrogynus (strain ATCC 38327) TaxID=578462 RepID=A0A0L0SLE0_ALLM3|nr:hypothetical protein AMAG_08350 [Allomyces macrogynus ATCC 38327]|eukprot:KNE63200.1 hypothetical protein AMAG_08350 [Allomyces macrogynus ATCC 38327]